MLAYLNGDYERDDAKIWYGLWETVLGDNLAGEAVKSQVSRKVGLYGICLAP